MVYVYDRQESTNWSNGDTITASRMQDINEELDNLLQRLDERNLSINYNVDGDVIQIVDNQNSITVDIDWTDFDSLGLLYIQEQGDSSLFTITYTGQYPTSVVYA